METERDNETKDARVSRDLLMLKWSIRGDSLDSKEAAIQHMLDHEAGVIRTIPPERLLLYRVTQGWGPLCQFLGKPIPSEEFPHANCQKDFMKNYGITEAVCEQAE